MLKILSVVHILYNDALPFQKIVYSLLQYRVKAVFCDIYDSYGQKLIMSLLGGLKSERRKKEIKGRLRLQYGCHGQDVCMSGRNCCQPETYSGCWTRGDG